MYIDFSLINLVPILIDVIIFFSFLFITIVFISYSNKNLALWAGVLALLQLFSLVLIKYPGYQHNILFLTSMLLLSFLLFSLFFIFHKNNGNLLYEKEMCFDDTFNKSGIGMALVTIDGRIIRTNQSLCNMLGYSDEELKSRRFHDITYPDDLSADLKSLEELLCGEINSKQIEKRYIHKQGNIIWAILNVSLIRDRNGKPQYFISQIQNITNTKALHNELIKKNLQYEILLNSYNNFIVVFDKKMRFVVANQCVIDTVNELLGRNYKNNTIIGHSIDEVLPDIENTRTYRTFKCVMKNKESKVTTVDYVKPNGQVNWYQFHVIPVDEGILVISADVTEIKKLEEIREKAAESERLLKEAGEMEKLRTEFFTNLSHEFRTPLNLILNADTMLYNLIDKESGRLKERGNKYLKISKQNCYRLMRLSNNIIDITKIDAGYLDLNLQCYNIVNIVEDIAQSVVDYAKNKEIEVIFDTDVEEKYILCDADKIERIMLNLLSNAIKFTGKRGNIEIRVSDKNESVEITVKDNGIGISENNLDLIFERFRQVDKSLTRNQEGSGIGLAIVKSLVEMHKGSIRVLSKVGKGTTFIIVLPSTIDEEYSKTASKVEQYNSKVEVVNIEFSDIYY